MGVAGKKMAIDNNVKGSTELRLFSRKKAEYQPRAKILVQMSYKPEVLYCDLYCFFYCSSAVPQFCFILKNNSRPSPP